MRFTPVEFVFMAFGGALGVLVAFAAKAGWVTASSTFPPFIYVLFGLGLAEIAAGFALNRSPGTLIAMPARIAGFVLGVGVLALINGGLA